MIISKESIKPGNQPITTNLGFKLPIDTFPFKAVINFKL